MVSPQVRKKCRVERVLVREFLEHLGLQYVAPSMRSTDCGNPRSGTRAAGPDVKITCYLGGRRIRVGIEVVEYQVDAKADGSLGRRINGVFWAIWKHLKPRLARNGNIRECTGSMYLDWACPPRPRDARAVATELARFLKDHLPMLSHDGQHRFSRRGRRAADPGDFEQYPLLLKHFTGLFVQRPSNLIGPLSWHYNSAAGVGVVEDVVVDLIQNKAAKLASYDRSGTSQTWLLICAGVYVPRDSAGPEPHGRHFLKSQRICAAAHQSGFDQVLFWERAHRWHVRLK